MAITKIRKFTDEELELIRTGTTAEEKRQAALRQGLIIDVVYKVCRKDRNVTETTEPVFKELLKKAKLNKKKKENVT